MKVGPAIALTMAVMVVSVILTTSMHFPVFLLTVPATAVWAVSDVVRLRQRYSADPAFVPSPDALATLQTSRPIIVFAACLLLWLFGLPWYLVMRGKLIAGAPAPKRESGEIAA
jgi:hypothetical protein